MRYISLALILSLVALGLACAPASSTPTTPAVTSPGATTSTSPATSPGVTTTSSPVTTTPAPSTTGAAGLTFGQLADSGETVFANSAASCHGDNGEGIIGPAVIGSGANLQKFNNAQELFDYIRTNMPQTAPGSLSVEQYQQVLGYILVQNGFVDASTVFDASQLSSIQLNR